MSDSDPLDGLEDLIITPDEAFEPYVRTVSVLLYKTRWKQPIDTKKAIPAIQKFLIEKWRFKKESANKSIREGFLQFRSDDGSLSCIFGRESSLKIDWVNEGGSPRMNTTRIRNLDSQRRVYTNIKLDPNSAEVVLFGGSDNIILRVAGLASTAVAHISAGGHETERHALTREEMLDLLTRFGSDVDYIFVDPFQSEMLRRTVTERQLNEDVVRVDYDVYTTYHGYRVTNSPRVQQTLQDVGVYIKEIQGRISYNSIRITVRINASGKIVLSIPTSIAPEEEDARRVAIALYKQIINEEFVGFTQETMDGFT